MERAEEDGRGGRLSSALSKQNEPRALGTPYTAKAGFPLTKAGNI